MKLKTAIIDLYNNEYNEGMRCIKEIVNDSGIGNDIEMEQHIFDARYKNEIPDLSFDLYVSSGGPGSPFEGEGSDWEKRYFNLIDSVISHNQKEERKKYFFFICHSFQIMARYFNFADVTQRPEKSFGIIPFTKTDEGTNDPLLKPLPNPFYAADFRQYQVINPNQQVLSDLNAVILSKEISEEGSGNEPAVMAVRISDEIAGTQFHPEADPNSMLYHLRQDERKEFIVNKFGERKYKEMLHLLEEPDSIKLTRKTVLPSFLNNAIKKLKNYD